MSVKTSNETGALASVELPTAHIPDEQALLEAFVAEWAADIEKIAAMLNREAEIREWCNEYDQIVSKLNESLHFKIVDRTEEFLVNFRGRGAASITIALDVDVLAHADATPNVADNAVRNELRRLFDRYAETSPEYVSIELNSTELVEISSATAARAES